jgi:hypothetical protein
VAVTGAAPWPHAAAMSAIIAAAAAASLVRMSLSGSTGPVTADTGRGNNGVTGGPACEDPVPG